MLWKGWTDPNYCTVVEHGCLFICSGNKKLKVSLKVRVAYPGWDWPDPDLSSEEKKTGYGPDLALKKNLSCSRSDFRSEGSGEKPDANPVFSNSYKIPGYPQPWLKYTKCNI